MRIRVGGIELPLDAELTEIREAALKKAGCGPDSCTDFRVVRQSVDARRKQVRFVYSVELEIAGRASADGRDITELPEQTSKPLPRGARRPTYRPIVVGTGPCGLFCALTLARGGLRPLVLERGADVDTRTAAVHGFWNGRGLLPQTNVQFGEGGAGTFSDGKLTTRITDPRLCEILRDFVRFGAPDEILWKAKPHIGTDILGSVVKNMRAELLRLGAEVRFGAQMTDILIKNGAVCAVSLAGGETLPCETLVLAPGHSARDTYEMLLARGVAVEPKAFSVGARVEHLQSFIDAAMYGEYAGHPKLGAAEYQLSYRNGADACYSFCMCPGGAVVAAASELQTVVTNGMSDFARAGRNANAALCVNVTEADFGPSHPLAGVYYQRELERRAFALGGGDYGAPAQLAKDFLDGRATKMFGKVTPSYLPGTVGAELAGLFSPRVARVMADGLRYFERKISGFTGDGAVLTGVETRTSAPVRIKRTETLESTTCRGLYPAGEGAGYAGGIMSAAADGVRTAERILSVFCSE